MDREWLLNTVAQLRAEGVFRILRDDVPPATESQLQETERSLGFPLSDALRLLYSAIANGGDILNPGPSFVGVIGGYSPYSDRDKPTTMEQLVSRSGWRFHERAETYLQADSSRSIECEDTPEGFVPIADLGCSQTVHWDMLSGRVYMVAPWRSLDYYQIDNGLAPTPGSEDIYTVGIYYLAPSVERFIEDSVNFRLTVRPRKPIIVYEDGEYLAVGFDDTDAEP